MTLAAHDVALVRADNPGPFTLSGTNTWLAGRDPCWIVDPGPPLDEHVAAVAEAAQRRGGAAGIVLTHAHDDHAGALAAVSQRVGAPHVEVAPGERAGPLEAVATPGHTPDHLAFVFDPGAPAPRRDAREGEAEAAWRPGGVAFTGDAVLGEGSVFVVGRLAEYLDALRALRDRGPALLCPGHGPVVEDPAAKLEEYVAHRLDRERRLLAALDGGARSVDALLDQAWDDAPAALRLAAAVTLGAHLDKLEAEGRLPEGVERPRVPDGLRAP